MACCFHGASPSLNDNQVARFQRNEGSERNIRRLGNSCSGPIAPMRCAAATLVPQPFQRVIRATQKVEADVPQVPKTKPRRFEEADGVGAALDLGRPVVWSESEVHWAAATAAGASGSCWGTPRRVRLMRPRLSISRTRTVTWSPTFTTSSTFSTRDSESCEM